MDGQMSIFDYPEYLPEPPKPKKEPIQESKVPDKLAELEAKYQIPRKHQKEEGWVDDWHYTEIETPKEHGIYYVIHYGYNADFYMYTYAAWFHGYWWKYAGYGDKWLICNDQPRKWMIPFAWVTVPDLYYRTDDHYQHLFEIFPTEKDWEYEKRMMELLEDRMRFLKAEM